MDFYDKIQGYEHLIIDLRNNLGGWTPMFVEFILGPNINETLYTYGFAFMVHGGELSQWAVSPFFSSFNSGFWPRGSRTAIGIGSRFVVNDRRGHIPLEEMLHEFELPQLNMHDMERIQYGFQIRYVFEPIRLSRFDYQPAFDGKIWFLVGYRTGSGSHLTSWWAHDTGFATFVGGNTGGNFGGNRVNFRLPNSRIRVEMDVLYFADRYGYGIEAGIIPHYRTRPGMDALTTVLALIDEGWRYGE